MKIKLFIALLVLSFACRAQELYVSTEPASNMAKGSIGLRFNSKLFQMNYSQKFTGYRFEPEIMFGVSKRLMVHVAGYGSNMFQKNFRAEGASLYGKYRFFSQDEVHEHFRVAGYAKLSLIKNPEVLITTAKHIYPDGNGGFVQHEEELHVQSNEIDLDGNNSGYSTGIIATKLKNKFAASSSLGYEYRLNNIQYKTEIFQPKKAITYSASAGYLLFPKEYTSYKQINLNLYFEMLGQCFLDKKQSYVDVAPAVQFIFNSIARVDLAYRSQLGGNVNRLSNNYFMLRLEYNLLNAFAKK